MRPAPWLFSLLGMCSPLLASAQPREPIELEWTAPAECPRVEVVRARLRKLAGPLKATAHPLRAAATITHNDEGGWHLRLLVRSGSLAGERNMDGKSCTALAGAAAVALVLLLHSNEPLSEDASVRPTAVDAAKSANDPTTTAPSKATTAQRDSIRAPESASPELERPRSSASRTDTNQPPERRWRGLLQLPQVELGLGPLHQPSFGLAIGGGISIERWRFLAKGSLWFPQHASASNAEQQYGADVRRATATLLACRAVVRSWLELSPCLSLAIQHLSARGTGAHVGTRTGTATWPAVGLGAQARAPIAAWISVFLGIDAQIQFSQPLLAVDEIGPVERLLPAAITTTLGSEWIF
ncbi:MAG TPA: hypothetical protein VJV79_30435 [Polyangiaceae bacterium]|nr:hypothetical protein [Polyangiaceae bacterium]